MRRRRARSTARSDERRDRIDDARCSAHRRRAVAHDADDATPHPQLRAAPGPHHAGAAARVRCSTGRATASTSPARRAISPRCSGAPRRSCSKSASATASSCCTRRSAEPERDFIGIEVHRPGVGRLLNALADAERRQCAHLSPRRGRGARARDRAARARRSAHLFPGSVAEEAPPEAPPDPARFRRAARIARRRTADACIWRPTGRTMPSICRACSTARRDWRRHAEHATSASRPAWRIDTHFERRGLRLGHGVWDLRL